MMEISRLAAEQTIQVLPDIAVLLSEAVNGGASIGFLPPLSPQEAKVYWRSHR